MVRGRTASPNAILMWYLERRILHHPQESVRCFPPQRTKQPDFDITWFKNKREVRSFGGSAHWDRERKNSDSPHRCYSCNRHRTGCYGFASFTANTTYLSEHRPKLLTAYESNRTRGYSEAGQLQGKPDLLQILLSSWTPKNLLLFSLGVTKAAAILGHEALNQVEHLALITELVNETQVLSSPTLVVYTLLSFLSEVPVLLGEWDTELFVSWRDLFVDRFSSFYGFQFELLWLTERPFTYQMDAEEPVQGISVKMLKSLSPVLNFTYTLTKGTRPWSNLLAVLYNREKHFSINNLYLSLERSLLLDASVPCWHDNYRIFLLNPKLLPKWMSIYNNFTHHVWIAIVMCLVAATLFLYLKVCEKLQLQKIVTMYGQV
ncbi:hypothetical protein E2C01_073980 [Portunus trituberculatus]|uniref:Uncharacterized protein n=1 Tax=Portunus trituberculatus TaxID=210409 RepID=A0A5B7I6T5_PORTR|nr:hypothetical protein [Portunus trituberculatus]